MKQLALLLAGLGFAGACAANPTGHFSNIGLFIDSCSFEISDPGSTYEEDCGGLTLSGSGQINDTVFIAAEFSGVETDDSNIELKRNFLGIGAKRALSDTLDLYGRVSLQKVKIVVPGFGSASDDGFGIAGGLSFNPSETVNLFAELELLALDETAGGALWLGAAFDLVPNFSIVLSLGGYGLEDDARNEYAIGGFRFGGRYNF